MDSSTLQLSVPYLTDAALEIAQQVETLLSENAMPYRSKIQYLQYIRIKQYIFIPVYGPTQIRVVVLPIVKRWVEYR